VGEGTVTIRLKDPTSVLLSMGLVDIARELKEQERANMGETAELKNRAILSESDEFIAKVHDKFMARQKRDSRLQALREVKEWVEANKYDLDETSIYLYPDICNADDLNVKLDEMIAKMEQ